MSTTIDIDHIEFLIRLFNTALKFSQLSATKQKLSIYLNQQGLVRYGRHVDDQADFIFITDKGRNLLVHLTQSATDYMQAV